MSSTTTHSPSPNDVSDEQADVSDIPVDESTNATSDPADASDPHAEIADTTTAEEGKAEENDQRPLSQTIKHWLLRMIDLTALTFLEPIVRLCYRDEPMVQVRKIGQMFVLPICAFVIFLGLWSVSAPHLKTKYGSLPTPGEVWDGWQSIMTFHNRENAKAQAYIANGDKREVILSQAIGRQESLETESKEAAAKVKEIEEELAARNAELLDPINAELESMQAAYLAEKKERQAAIKTMATELGDGDDRSALIEASKTYTAWNDTERKKQSALKEQRKAIQDEKYKPLELALLAQTAVDEEKQFNKKIIELAGDKSREGKIIDLNNKLADSASKLDAATGKDAEKLAMSIARNSGKEPGIQASTYPRPWTLPMQIVRSVLTVFTGFLIGVAIAIPIGICCGLSPTFMSMLTPFIALFKPVSPIVWLLIFWIIVGGFIPNPDGSQALGFFNDIGNFIVSCIPYANSIIDDIDINPAFIASALTVSMCSLWATMVNTALGVASVDKDHINVARVLRLGFFARLRKIILPSALPLMFAGMRISLGIGWMVLIAAELLASSEGLGKFTNDMFQNGNTDSFAKIMVMVFVVGIIGLILDRIMIVFQRLVSFEGSVAAI